MYTTYNTSPLFPPTLTPSKSNEMTLWEANTSFTTTELSLVELMTRVVWSTRIFEGEVISLVGDSFPDGKLLGVRSLLVFSASVFITIELTRCLRLCRSWVVCRDDGGESESSWLLLPKLVGGVSMLLVGTSAAFRKLYGIMSTMFACTWKMLECSLKKVARSWLVLNKLIQDSLG